MDGFMEGYIFLEKNVTAVYGANAGNDYINSINQEVDELSKKINAFKGFKTDESILKGDVAEFWHSGTHNIDAVLKGAKSRTTVGRSHNLALPDITSNFGEEFGLKYYKDGESSAKAQSESIFERYSEYKAKSIRENKSYKNLEEFLKDKGYDDLHKILNDPIYSGQIRIIPKDQMEDAIKWLERKIREESAIRPDQVQRYQDTLNLLRDRVKSSEGTESIALSEEDAKKLARLAKEGNFHAEDYGLTTEELVKYKYIMKEAFKTGLTAATISMVLRVAPEVCRAIEHLIRNGEVDEKQFQKIGFAAIQGGTEGFIRGSIAAAITTVCKAGLWGEPYKSINPSVVGTVTVLMMNVMKNSFLVAKGKMTRHELTDVLMRDMLVSSCSLVLGRIGLLCIIEMPILGFMLGSFAGSVIGSFAYSTGYKTYISFCIDTGFTMFRIVEQDYSLPIDVLKEIGVEVFEYEKFKYDKFEYDKFQVKKFQYNKFDCPTIGIKILKRGVIGVNQIGYV